MKSQRAPRLSRRARAAAKLRHWYEVTPAGIQDDWSGATSRCVLPEGALARFRTEHPEVSTTGARRVEEALLQWVRIEGRRPGTHDLPSRAVEALWKSLRQDESAWETFRDSLGIELHADLDAVTHWVPDDDSEPMRATWSDAFDDEVPFAGCPTLFIVDGEVGIADPTIELPAWENPPWAVSPAGPPQAGSEEHFRGLERLCGKHWLYLMLASLIDAPSVESEASSIEPGQSRARVLRSARSCPRCRSRNELHSREVVDERAHRSRRRPLRWLIAGAVAVAVAVAVAQFATVSRHAAQLRATAGVAYSVLRVGDCVRTLTGPAGLTPAVVDVVDCTASHTAEVYAVFTLRDGTYPGQHQVEAMAERGCDKRFFAYVANSVSETTLDVYYIYPTAEIWSEDHDREVLCTVESPGHPTTRSVRHSGL
jgi:hypothetical protein